MSTRLFLLLSVVAAILQGPILPQVFFEGILVIFLLISRVSRRVPAAIFLSGVVFDLFQNQTLGVTPLIFIIVGFLHKRIGEGVPITRPEVLAGIVLLVNLTRSYFVFDTMFSISILLSTVLSYVLFRTFWVPERGGIRL